MSVITAYRHSIYSPFGRIDFRFIQIQSYIMFIYNSVLLSRHHHIAAFFLSFSLNWNNLHSRLWWFNRFHGIHQFTTESISLSILRRRALDILDYLEGFHLKGNLHRILHFFHLFECSPTFFISLSCHRNEFKLFSAFPINTPYNTYGGLAFSRNSSITIDLEA